MRELIRKLKWLLKNQEQLELLLSKKVEPLEDKGYSISGVPDFQREYVDKILRDKEV